MKRIKKIGIVCAYEFPEGMAPSIRILTYCTGLNRNGVATEIFSFKETPTDCNSLNTGIAMGIPYQKSYFKRPGNNPFHKLCDKLRMLNRLYNQIKTSNEREAFDYLLLSFDTIDKLLSIIPLCRQLGCKLLFIGDEFPEPIRRLKTDIPWWYKLSYKFLHRFLDGRILMTKNLKDFYDKKVFPLPTYILNSVINEDRFKGISKSGKREKYLCYMGNMQLAKDNVDNIIKAFASISSDYPEYELWLFGNPNQRDLNKISSIINSYDLNDRILLKGRVDYEEVPQILADAELLVTSQPITVRAQGGFPTKMAEYMMSGTPMLVTNVGEIPNYVKDGETTYMVDPGNPEKYAEKLRYILSHTEEAKKVAEKAKHYALENFCSRQAMHGLIDFLNTLN